MFVSYKIFFYGLMIHPEYDGLLGNSYKDAARWFSSHSCQLFSNFLTFNFPKLCYIQPASEGTNGSARPV
jgi:hypothetical protein